MMEREKFMQEARLTAHRILEGKENGIMNLVQQAWAEGKRSAEVETLRAAIEEALNERDHKQEQTCAVYPTWIEWLKREGVIPYLDGLVITTVEDDCFCNAHININEIAMKPIPADIAEKRGLKPKDG
jgi:hypothetical protein